ncbi:MAG: FtsX-like permease family protein [Acidimicrobiales bacterium]
MSLPATVDVTDLAAVGGIASVTERSAIESVLTNDALRRSLVGGVQLVMTAASAITVAGVGFTALLVVHARRRQSALLAALGADRRTIDRTVFAELLVSLVAAVAVGLATSGVVLRLIGPAIVPDEVAGGRLSPTPSAVAAAVALLALGGAVAFTIRRIVPNRTSRTLRLEVT